VGKGYRAQMVRPFATAPAFLLRDSAAMAISISILQRKRFTGLRRVGFGERQPISSAPKVRKDHQGRRDQPD
jgi:hypothetical protein